MKQWCPLYVLLFSFESAVSLVWENLGWGRVNILLCCSRWKCLYAMMHLGAIFYLWIIVRHIFLHLNELYGVLINLGRHRVDTMHYPFLRVRSWNNGMRWVLLCSKKLRAVSKNNSGPRIEPQISATYSMWSINLQTLTKKIMQRWLFANDVTWSMVSKAFEKSTRTSLF